MGQPFSKCGECRGNMWPDGQLKFHDHADPDDNNPLKLKHRTPNTGRKGGAKMRTNASRPKFISLRPRRRAYGPW